MEALNLSYIFTNFSLDHVADVGKFCAEPAAWALTNLYATIAAQARGKWGKMPPQHAFTLTFGGVQIMMQCAQRPIPWLFVGNFAERLLQLTDTGWTGVYVLLFSQAQSDTSITVSLKLHV